MSGGTEIAIVARSEIVREGLDNILAAMDFIVVAKAMSARGLFALLAGREAPCLIVLDGITADDAIAECSQIRQAFPSAQLLLMADDYRLDAVSRAFGAGVGGYLVKGVRGDTLASALRLVSLGEHVIPSATVTALAEGRFAAPFQPLSTSTLVEMLSEREQVILRWVARGDPNKLISQNLGITETTVKGHIKAILRKLGLTNRTQAAMWAIFNGLAPIDDSSVHH